MTVFPVATVGRPRPERYPQVAFVSLLRDGAGFHGVYREFEPRRSDVHTSIRYQRYSLDFVSAGASRLLLDHAEDPRIFEWRGRVWATSNADQRLVDVLTGDVVQLRHNLRYAGKNWVPVVGGDRLLFIRSIDPLCVLAVDDDWACTPIIPEFPTSYIGKYRGGGTATVTGNIITGVGHRTIENPLSHTPFTYQITLQTARLSIHEFQPNGFGPDVVIDPTSNIGERIVCCTSARHWWDEQEITTRICEITS
jgi:hypothetical protein